MTSSSTVIEQLAEAIVSSELVIWIGDLGTDKAGPGQLPSHRRLAELLRDDLEESRVLSLLETTDLYMTRYGRNNLEQICQGYLHEPGLMPTTIHKALASLCPSRVVYMGWDRLYEKAYEQRNCTARLRAVWNEEDLESVPQVLGLPPTLLGEMKSVLYHCGPFDSNESLRALFVREGLDAHVSNLPERDRRFERVEATIHYLHPRYSDRGENALLLLLEELLTRTDERTDCYVQLQKLIDALGPLVTRQGSVPEEETLLIYLNGAAGASTLLLTSSEVGDRYYSRFPSPLKKKAERWLLEKPTLFVGDFSLYVDKLEYMLTAMGAPHTRYGLFPGPLGRLQTLITPVGKDMDLEQFLTALQAKIEQLRHRQAGPGALALTSPYLFLDYYSEEHQAIFFGREEDTKEVGQLVREAPLTILLGESGVGKTSLLRAGIMPRIKEQGWYTVAYARCGPDPFRAVKQALLPFLPESNQAYFVHRAVDADLLDNIVMQLFLSGESGQVVVILDQFEEIFTKTGHREMLSFFEAMRRLMEERDVRFLISIRADEYHSLLDNEIRAIIPFIGRHFWKLPPFREEQAREVIRRPPTVQQLSITRGLEDQLIEDLFAEQSGKYVDPTQLAIVCTTLFEKREGRPEIDLALYHSLGGVVRILNDYVDKALDGLPAEMMSKVRAVLKPLVRSEGRKDSVDIEDVVAMTGYRSDEVQELLDILVERRLVRRLEEGPPYELAHDRSAEKIRSWFSEEEIDRKALSEMLRQELRDHQLYESYISPQKLARVNQVGQLPPLAEQAAVLNLIINSCLYHEIPLERWRQWPSQLSEESQARAILEASKREEPDARARAARVLGLVPLPGVRNRLYMLLQDPVQAVALAALRALEHHPQPEDLPALEPILIEGERELQLAALAFLSCLEDDPKTKPLLHRFLAHPDVDIFLQVIRILGEKPVTPEDVEEVGAYASSSDLRRQHAAVGYLAQADLAVAVPYLERATQDGHAAIRSLAMQGLERNESIEAVDVLVGMLHRSTQPALVELAERFVGERLDGAQRALIAERLITAARAERGIRKGRVLQLLSELVDTTGVLDTLFSVAEHDAEAGNRVAAFAILVEKGPQKRVQGLAEQLIFSDPASSVVRRAVHYLVSRPVDVDLLFGFVHVSADDWAVGCAVAALLAAQPDTKLPLEQMECAAQHPDAQVRRQFLRALLARRPALDTSLLAMQMGSSDEEQAVRDELQTLPSTYRTFVEENVDALVRALITTTATLDILDRYLFLGGTGIDVLHRILQDPVATVDVPEERLREVTDWLRQQGTEQGIHVLLGLIQEGPPAVCEAALESLTVTPPEWLPLHLLRHSLRVSAGSSRDGILAALRALGFPEEMHQGWLEILAGETGGRNPGSVLNDLAATRTQWAYNVTWAALEHPDHTVREVAVRSLVRWRSNSVVGILEKAYWDEERVGLKEVIAQALDTIGTLAADEALHRLRDKETDRWLRNFVVALLSERRID